MDMTHCRRMAKAGRMTTLAGLILLSGCATNTVVYEKEGAGQEERDRDQQACLRSAMEVVDARGVVANVQFDREVYQRCMESRGYIAKSR
jgi:hypothetical protein